MGCGTSSLDQRLKGTTLIGFVYDKGVIIGAESRASNEHEELKYPLTNKLRDQKNKMACISTHIIYVVQGVEADCTAMIKHMSYKFPNTGKVYTVSSVVETMCKYLENLNDEGKACGAIIGGWDASGPQVHRVFLKNKKAHKERTPYPAALGSGQTFALSILNKDYNYVMSAPYAINLGRKALYNSTYYDKHSGGRLTVYHIDENGWEECVAKDALEAHTMYYDLHPCNEENTLFLVVDAGIQPAISANDIADHFKPYAKLFASHRVALYKSGDDHFYFHRLVFESQHDAERAYNTTKSHDRSTPSYLEQFPRRVKLNKLKPSITVYVNWGSRELLDFFNENCELKYQLVDPQPT